MDTPYTDHLTAYDLQHVYEPAEDSFLLLDALEEDLDFLDHIQPRVFLEIGSGSGIIISALSKRFQNSLCLATDINMHACNVTQRTAQRNNARVDTLRCNLVDNVRANSIDVLLFNPPYVVTSNEELHQHKDANTCNTAESLTKTNRNLIYSWAGGLDGRRVTDALLDRLDAVLSPQGVFYLLLLRENKPEELILQLHALKFNAIIFKERRIPGEYLYILKITRCKS